MIAKQVLPNLYMVTQWIPTGTVNAYIIITDEGLALIDTGYLNNSSRMLKAIQQLGYAASSIKWILATHGHSDHVGSLAALKRASGAEIYMHPVDAEMVQAGNALREETQGTPGCFNQMAFAIGVRLLSKTIAPVKIDHRVQDADVLNIAGGIRVIHVPGHSAGQVAYLWQGSGVLFAADAVVNLFGKLRYGPVVENFDLFQQSIQRLCSFTFDTACFGHGESLIGQASSIFKQRWK